MAFMPNMPFMGGRMSLSGLSDDQLRQLSVNTGIAYEFLKAQQRAEMASAGSQGIDSDEDIIPTVEVKIEDEPKKSSEGS